MLDRRWVFIDSKRESPLTGEEVRYWKNSLYRILKAGLEFEFNLPKPKGSCKGNSVLCPCIHFNDSDCWTKCALTEHCKNILGDKFDETCSTTSCSKFTMACVTCEDFELDCVSCKYRFDPSTDPDSIRNYLRETLSPSKRYGKINKYGVHDIVCDGSLLGSGSEGKGAEILTTGRRVDYWEFYKMIDTIIKEASSKNAYVNERCSVHVHLLASYYDSGPSFSSSSISELERPMPQIILTNLHQLCRKYQNAITWMSMGLDDRDHLTRWEKYRVSILDVSPIMNSMRRVIDIMEEKTSKRKGKYGWINYMFNKFDKNGDLVRFHVELRSLDGMMSASAVTAMTCLFYALVIKAVEISRYGIVEIGSKDWVEHAYSLKKRLLNNMSGWNEGDRLSDTSNLSEEDFKYLTEESISLLNQVKHILLRLGPAYDVLERIAYKPVALRRCAGQSWEEIENDIKVELPEETKLEKILEELIDIRAFTGLDSENDWKIRICSAISEQEGTNVTEAVNEIIETKKSDGEYLWSSNIGTMLKV